MYISFRPKIYQDRTKDSGMSMIEVVVAMGVLVLIGGALVTLVLQAVALSNSAKMRSIASRYAEEGMEVVRSIRGPQVDWVGFRESCVVGPPLHGYFISSTGTKFYCDPNGDLPDEILAICPSEPCGLLQNNAGYTDFYRVITLQGSGSPPDSVKVTVKVTWNDQGKPRDITLVSLLTKWQ